MQKNAFYNFQVTETEDVLINQILIAKYAPSTGLGNKCLSNFFNGIAIFHKTINHLKSIGIISTTYDPPHNFEDVIFKNIPFTVKFDSAVSGCEVALGSELLAHYPKGHPLNSNCDIELNSYRPYYENELSMFHAYAVAINWIPSWHQEIIELIDSAKTTNYPFGTIGYFVHHKGWNHLIELTEIGVLPQLSLENQNNYNFNKI